MSETQGQMPPAADEAAPYVRAPQPCGRCRGGSGGGQPYSFVVGHKLGSDSMTIGNTVRTTITYEVPFYEKTMYFCSECIAAEHRKTRRQGLIFVAVALGVLLVDGIIAFLTGSTGENATFALAPCVNCVLILAPIAVLLGLAGFAVSFEKKVTPKWLNNTFKTEIAAEAQHLFPGAEPKTLDIFDAATFHRQNPDKPVVRVD